MEATSMANTSTAEAGVLDFVLLCGRLKQTKRTGWVMCNVENPESVADHMYRMALISFLLPREITNREKCIKMALVHDLGESIVGDITPVCGVSPAEKFSREKEAFERIRAMLDQDIGNEIYDLWEEFECGTSVEAQYVRDIDKFELILQAYEYEKAQEMGLQRFFEDEKVKYNTEFFQKLDKEVRQRRAQLPHISASSLYNSVR